jgi:tetratricopeptide (TPR) repeat protein
LQSDKEILRLEKIALESRVKQLSMQGIASTVLPPVPTVEDAARIRQLERERDDLQKKLEAANKELFGRNGKAVAGRVEEMENQLATLRARLEVFESRQVPYSPEELALFKRPETRLAVADPKAGKKSIRELPAGSASLVAEAQRYFSVKQLDKAEEKYLQVLRQDEKNVPTLANLAAIQLERDEMSEAEKNIKQAVALAPDDSYSLSILGYLKFRQEKYDDALDALSRAAKLDPQNAQVQNYLGITLSHKGMRGPAETALRKSIQLEPGYGSAHHNLAIIYLTQSPPLVELGRWHYQKALASGHPRNPEVEKMLEAPKTADNRGP